MGQYLTLLEAAIAAPETTLSTLPLLPAAEQALLQRWNATAAPYPEDRIFAQLFEAQAAATPTAPALLLRGQRHLLWRAQCAGECGRARAPRPRRRSRQPGRALGPALASAARRAHRHSEVGRRLCSARSRLPGRTARLHARRQRRQGARDGRAMPPAGSSSRTVSRSSISTRCRRLARPTIPRAARAPPIPPMSSIPQARPGGPRASPSRMVL